MAVSEQFGSKIVSKGGPILMPQGFSEAPAKFRGVEAQGGWLRLALTDERDTLMRMAAFQRVGDLARVEGVVRAKDLDEGFIFEGVRYPLYNPRRGIFKPKEMHFLLSIKTVFPKPGNRVWYDDQREVHRQIYEGDELIDYSFTGADPDAADNRNLRVACEEQIPLVYFLGIRPALYQVVTPVFVTEIDRAGLRARVTVGLPDQSAPDVPSTPIERRYALRAVKQRLHQASFREAVIFAYQGRCALSGLPEPLLLDAAHIMADTNELFGQPVVQNGLPLSKTHHAAFDAHLIGIDGDYRIHVSDRLMSLNDGPVLEDMKKLDGTVLRDPKRERDKADSDRLASRFELFKAAA
jgi:putative restriction endonuclease